MKSTVLRGSAFRGAIPAAAAGRLSGVEGVAVVLQPSHSRRLHSSTRADLPPKSSLDELDALYEVVRATKVSSLSNDILTRIIERVRATKVSSLSNDILTRIIESSSNARREFVQKEVRRTWMICAATVGGFFTGLLITRKMDNKTERELGNETYDNLAK
ncbi:uncharacterized protein [Triticum aestivum]|uniref:uncharacterized protein n=1 Tax=Triticum aestivum TaxID=4565 RepID=UPI001D018871|nr:uncharacterized protein LOC123141298 [Triticum aestivum]